MTVRLATFALQNWSDVDGYAVAHNMPPLQTLSIDRFGNFIWWFITRNAEQKERDQLEGQLWIPPKGVTPTTGPWAADAEKDSFASLKRAMTN